MSARSVRISRSKVIGVVTALACLAFSALGLAVNEPPEYSYVDGVRGQPVSIERAEVTAEDLQIGVQMVDDGAVEAQTSGMFVVVRTSLAVPGPQRVNLSRAQLVTQDRTYSEWFGGGVAADPGFAQTTDLVFEVDPAEIDDLSLEIWYGAIVHGVYQRARIHLGITPANADQWRQAAAGRSVEPDRTGTTEALP